MCRTEEQANHELVVSRMEARADFERSNRGKITHTPVHIEMVDGEKKEEREEE